MYDANPGLGPEVLIPPGDDMAMVRTDRDTILAAVDQLERIADTKPHHTKKIVGLITFQRNGLPLPQRVLQKDEPLTP